MDTPKIGWMSTRTSILRTTDAGVTWKVVTPESGRVAPMGGVDFVNSQKAFMVHNSPGERG